MGSNVYPAAASGPTLAEIQTAISTYSTPYNGTWTDLGTTTVSGSTTTTITGLGGYKQLRIYLNLSPSVSSFVTMRVNGDTGSNYGWAHANPATNSYNYAATSMTMSPSSGAALVGYITISPANNSSAKKTIMTEKNWQSSGYIADFHGFWNSNAAVTSVTFTISGGSFSPGYITIWGIN